MTPGWIWEKVAARPSAGQSDARTDDSWPVGLRTLTVAGFFEAAGVLAEEFQASAEAFRKTVFGGWICAGAFSGGELLVVAFLLFVVDVAADQGEDMAVFGEDRVEDAATEAPAAFVAAAFLICAASAL